jgi:alpha-N-arabinofuranosidase
MFSGRRRDFLRQVSTAGIALYAKGLFGPLLNAQTVAGGGDVSRIYVDSRRTIAPLDRNLFGSFLEHLGRAIHEGIYDPGSSLSDASGFRTDVMDQIKKLGVPLVRYPGGNFVSGYNWLDGVGPKQDRPMVLDKAWNTLENNQFGTNEFMSWCKAVGTKPLMGLNLGTGTPEKAAALVEYCNVERGTEWSDLRRKHGYPDAYHVEHWCRGHEIDGPWQIGLMTATEF